ncbi:MAG: hypothetical protein U0Q20_04555 [Mycobacterium sp.]|nr:hypothetical protein [Mycobacterium sp.]
MEPIEINAGSWYLRALRADERIDDRPALADMGITSAGYVADSLTGWQQDVRYTWAVCEPTTGELLGEVTLSPSTGMIEMHARAGHAVAVQTAADAVRRFADSLQENT